MTQIDLFAAAKRDSEPKPESPETPARDTRGGFRRSGPPTPAAAPRVSDPDVVGLIDWLRPQVDWGFAQSLVKQFDAKGGLTANQIATAQRIRAEREAKAADQFLDDHIKIINVTLPPPKPVASTPETQSAPAQVRGTVTIPDSTYTVVFEDGDYRTLRVKTQPETATFKPGARIISYLAGPDNTRSYKSFGHFDGDNVVIWKKFSDNDTLRDAVRVLVADPKAAASAYGLRSGKCGVCGRKLTTPESIEQGIGPVCIEKAGW